MVTTECSAEAGPAWFQSLPERTWTGIGQNTIADAAPSLSRSIITAWCGGSSDPVAGKYYITNQGGHAAETKGHVLVFDLATASWSLRGSVTQHNGLTPVMSNGGPAAAHSEDQICYVPPANGRTAGQIVHTMLPFFNFNNGGGDAGIYSYNLTSGVWSGRLTALTHSYLGNFAGGSAYDSRRDLVWIMALQGIPSLHTWNPQSPTATPIQRNQDRPSPGMNAGWITQLTYSPTKDCLVTVNGADGNWFYVVDCASPSTYLTPAQSGSRPTLSGLGGVWSSKANGGSGAFIFGSSSTTTLWKLTPPAGALNGTWTWNAVNAAGGSISSPYSDYQDTTSRLQLFENVFGTNRDLLVVVNRIDAPVFVHKLPIGGL